MTVEFLMGTHEPGWLARLDVPLFVSHVRLKRRPLRSRACCSWALDSGAFSEVARHGEFTTSPAEYIAAVRSYRDELGGLMWAAPQDHMCESWVLERSSIANSVLDAQRYTVDNYLELRRLDAALPIIPVLQGQTLADYRAHVEMYAAAQVDLWNEPLVGLGSVCRRQATREIAELVASLSNDGLRLHGFGVKTDGIRLYGWCLASADSLAWSYDGRRVRPCPHTGAKSCNNCLPHALAWRARVVEQRRPIQLAML